METIRIGGVPEHFNLPIHLAIESGAFSKEGIDVKWKDFEGGTGQMTQALQQDECDICIVLTEGIVSAIFNNNPSKIISGYTKSPLVWGVHTRNDGDIKNYNKIFDKKIAISRIGSGSHLMPMVDAMLKDKKIEEDQFVKVQNIEGAIDSLNRSESDIFYWEKFMTKPYVEKKLLKRIGEFVSPWPCFQMAATEKIIKAKPQLLDRVLKIIHKACDLFMKDPNAPSFIADRYQLGYPDAQHWYHTTEWAIDSWVSDKMLANVCYTLKEAGLLPYEPPTEMFVWQRK